MSSWTSFIAPAVVAAVISSVVAAVGIWMSVRTTRAIHVEKLAFDRDQAERRVSAEIALAEKKFNFDKALANWRRRYELAEQALTTAYEARAAIDWVRTPALGGASVGIRRASEAQSDYI
jgi:hypothetical protein